MNKILRHIISAGVMVLIVLPVFVFAGLNYTGSNSRLTAAGNFTSTVYFTKREINEEYNCSADITINPDYEISTCCFSPSFICSCISEPDIKITTYLNNSGNKPQFKFFQRI